MEEIPSTEQSCGRVRVREIPSAGCVYECTAMDECNTMDGCTAINGCTAMDGCTIKVRRIK